MFSYMDLMFRSALTPGKSASVYSIAPFKEKNPDWFMNDLKELMHLLEHGKIKPVISKKLLLTEATKAHKLLEARGVKGKIVLRVNAS